MASEKKPGNAAGYVGRKSGEIPEQWKNKEIFDDYPEGYNPPSGKDLEKYRVRRKGQLADVSWESLKYEELPVSSAPLISAGQMLGVACRVESQDFQVCKRETKDPRRCLDQGKAVSDCARSFLMKIRKHCRSEFRDHWDCLDKHNLQLSHCAKYQPRFDQCVLERIGVERPTTPPIGSV